MMLQDLLMELSARKIELQLDGSNVRVKAPKGAMTATHRAAIQAHKPELLRYLRHPKDAPSEDVDDPLSLYPADPAELLALLRSIGVRFQLRADRIVCARPEGSIPEAELHGLLKRHYAPLLALLREETAQSPAMEAVRADASAGRQSGASGEGSPLTEEERQSARFIEGWNRAAEERNRVKRG